MAENVFSEMDFSGLVQPLTPKLTSPFHEGDAFRAQIESASQDLAEWSKTDWHQLMILGNGFDLQCGLPSGFGDFFRHRYEVIASISDYRQVTWNKLIGENQLTLWDFILASKKEAPWCNIEEEIANWILPLCPSYKGPVSAAQRAVEHTKSSRFAEDSPTGLQGGRMPDEQEDGDYFLGNIARCIWTLQPDIRGKGYSAKQLIALLKRELTRFEEAFEHYLQNQVSITVDYGGKCKELYELIAHHGMKSTRDYHVSTSVLSFNYTTGIHDVFEPGENGVCVNIHGKLGGEIIIGIDGKECLAIPEAAQFTKTYRLMTRGGSLTDRLFVPANKALGNNATDIIKFYGHSLSEADYSYFQSIFDSVSLYDSNTLLVFYTRCQTEETKDTEQAEENRATTIESITKLLNDYGATMDNKDHGKNLIHKLLVEGRLKVITPVLN